MVRGKQVRRALARAGAALAMLATAATLAGCEPSTPLALNSYVDATFSNHRVAGACVGEVMRGAEAAARSQGSFSLHTFDGDPLERSGIVRQFSEDDVPRSIRGTAKVDEFLTSEAEAMRTEVRQLIETAPRVGGTPLLAVLTRAARLKREGQVEGDQRILICTDGLFTDIGPDPAKARELAENLDLRLDGATVDFVGLAESLPGTGPQVERLRPAVEAVLVAAGARMGVWDVELPARWP